MIKKLRRRFVFVSMLSVVIVITLIMGIINLVSYVSIVKSSDQMIEMISDNGGFFPHNDFDPGAMPDKIHDKKAMLSSPEAPYETRFFTVELDSSKNVNKINTGSIAAVSREDAVDYAEDILESGRSKGFTGVYRYMVSDTGSGYLVVFLDRSREINSMKSFAKISLGISLLGIICIFLLVLFFSKKAIQPVAVSYAKQKQFITDAGHELKTPLTIINSNTDVLEMTQGENEWTQSIKSQVKRLTKLTNELVSLSRLDEENSKIIMTDFSLSDALIETLEPYKKLAEQNGKRMDVFTQLNVTYNGNEDSVRKLFGILADNAIKYSNDGGSITVSLKQLSKGAVITFSNTVDAIEKGSHDVLFERFYRADKSRSSESGGYGIGLSIAKAIVQSHRGKISAKSEDGKSLVIIVNL